MLLVSPLDFAMNCYSLFNRSTITISFLSWMLLIAPLRLGAAEISGTLSYQGEQSGPILISITRLTSGNQVLTLDGDGDYVIVEDLTDLSGSEITIQYWFRGASTQSAVRQQSGSGWIVAGWNNKHIISNDSGTAGIAAGAAIIDGDWHQVTMTWKQGEANGFASYLDGQLVASKDAADEPIPSHDHPLYFGAFQGTHEFANGMLDEIVVWDRALSPEEVAQNWFRRLTGKEAGIIGYWTFDNGEADDLSPNVYHGYLEGDADIVATEIPGLDGFFSIRLDAPGNFAVADVPTGGGYRLSAFLDVNDNGLREATEPWTNYGGNSFEVTAPRTVIDLELQERPRILNHPADQRLNAGETIRLSVEAGGSAPLQWQWRHNGQDLVDGDRISGANSNELTIDNAVAGDSGSYNCQVSNSAGETFSDAANLQIIEGGLTVSGEIQYDGDQTGPIHLSIAQVRPDNQVLTLDGDLDYAVTPLTDLSGSEISIQFWFRGTSVQSAVRQQSSGYIVAGWNGTHILSIDGGTVGISAGGAEVTDGNWHQITMTWQRNTPDGFRSYLDGRLIAARDSVDSEIPNFEAQVYFGCFNGSHEFANGQLDEISIWDRALTEAEVLVGWNYPLSGDEAGLIGYWTFDDGTGTDLVGGNDAELHGDALIEKANIPGFGSAVFTATLDAPGPYVMSQILPGNNVELTAFMDVNGNQGPDAEEPQGGYAGNPFKLSENVTGIDLTLAEPPALVVQPADARATSGSSAVAFQAQARGTAPLSWQWHRNGVELADNAKFQGVNTAQLTVDSPTGDETGNYSVTVSNSRGQVTSRAARLTFVTGQTATLAGNLSYGGTPPGMIHVTAAQFVPENRALKLDGEGDTVIVEELTDLSGFEITVQFWYRGKTFQSPVRQQSAGWIVAGWSSRHLHILSNDGGTSGIFAGPGITDGTWNHVAMTWEIDTAAGFRSYLNGEPIAQRDSSDQEIPLIGAPLYFGSFNGSSEFLEGELDEIAVWGRALDPEEIQSGWNAPLTGEEDDLLGLWKFDDDTPHDSSLFQFEGKLLGDAEIVTAEIPGFGGVIFTDVFAASGAFAMPDLPQGDNYRLKAFVDLNGNYLQDPDEPATDWTDQPFTLDRDLSDFSFDLGGMTLSVNLAIMLEGDNVTISWPEDAMGAVLYQRESLTAGAWSAVEGVSGNRIELPARQAAQFFQLR